MKAERTLNRSELIRIGGQCKDQRLSAFSERANYYNDSEVVAARSCINALNQLRESIQFTLDHHVSSFRSYFQQTFCDDKDDSTRRKSLIEATTVLMECLVRVTKLEESADEPDEELEEMILELNRVS